MMTVLESKVNEDKSVWLRVILERNTDILVPILYTDRDMEEAKKLGVEEFLKKLKMMVDCY